MTNSTSLEDALAFPLNVESLSLQCKDLDEISARIGELKNLRSLRLDNVHAGLIFPESIKGLTNLEKLDISGAHDASVPFPPIFLEMPITDLELRDFRVREAFALKDQVKRLRLRSYFIFDDIGPLCANFTKLEHLEIWGRLGMNQAGNPGVLKFPAAIANLAELAELEVVYAGMRELPVEMAELSKLRVIRLRNQAFEVFPLALTTVPNLEDLEFAQMNKLSSFPAELANMASLRRLDLNHSWNQPDESADFMDSLFEDSDVEVDPLPNAIGQIPHLEELILDHCKVDSLDSIARLTELRTLSLAWAQLGDIQPLAAMKRLTNLNLEHVPVSDLSPLSALQSLEVLDISRTHVSDFGPLAELQNLRTLDISSCAADNRNPQKALEVLIDLPNLLEVKSDKLEEGAWQKLRASEPSDPAQIIAALQSDDFDEFMTALRKVIAYSDERSTDDHNALVDLFGLDVDDYDVAPVGFPPLDDAIDRWGKEIPAMDLARLARATFICTSDGWVATLKALRLLIQSKDLEAQLLFVQGWERATRNYDGGHRFWEDGVHDQLIDELWELFQPEAIAALMLALDSDQLDSEYGDAMDVLFAPALKGLKTYDEDLIEHLREYALSNIDSSYGASPTATLAMIEECIPHAIEPIQVALRQIASDMRSSIEGGTEIKEASEATEEPQSENTEEARPTPQAVLANLQTAFNEPGVSSLISALELATELGDYARVRDGAAAFTNNKLIVCLRAGEVAEGVKLAEAYDEFVEETGLPSGMMRNEIATNTLILAVHSGDENVERFAIDRLLPDHIGHTGLAYNLSCYWATKGNRDKMLEAITLSIELGKEPERFLADTDFEPFWEEPDFLKALGREPAAESHARRFEFHDAKSAKFWSIEVVGAELNLAWGKVGTAGQSKTKSFSDAAAAEKEAEKLIKSKTTKGYEEV